MNAVILPASFVRDPTQTTRRPCAKLSSVPVCPTLVVFKALLTLPIAEKEVGPGCFENNKIFYWPKD